MKDHKIKVYSEFKAMTVDDHTKILTSERLSVIQTNEFGLQKQPPKDGEG